MKLPVTSCLWVIIAASAWTGCRASPAPSRVGSADGTGSCRAVLEKDVQAFLSKRQPAYMSSRLKARAWLDELSVDPEELRTHGIKGKKKLVELLDGYVWMMRSPLPGEEKWLRERIEHVVAITRTDGYHDMADVDDLTFKQDATSYMRAAYLMDGLGLDTTFYREQMEKVKPRYDAHMSGRGPAQQMIFHLYYQHFGLAEPFPLDRAFEKGVIAGRPDPAGLERMDIYHLTHEIFMPFRYGEVRETDFFDESDVTYLTGALPVLVKRRIQARDPDLVAELVLCMEYLDLENHSAYLDGLGYLLENQNEDGSWGHYPDADRSFGEWASYHVYLHTTKLAASALINAWRCPD